MASCNYNCKTESSYLIKDLDNNTCSWYRYYFTVIYLSLQRPQNSNQYTSKDFKAGASDQEDFIAILLNTQGLIFSSISSPHEFKDHESGAGARNLFDCVQAEALPKPSSQSSEMSNEDQTSLECVLIPFEVVPPTPWP